MMPKYRLCNPLLLLLALLGIAACVPTHTVRPLPQFVLLALEVGDSVIVRMRDGTQLDMTLTAVFADAIEGDGQRIELADIQDIQKRAWEAPPSPCGGEKPLGCSVPWVVRLASDVTNHYHDAFHDACVQHDYCYRHGARSYGHTRDDCDAEFLANMLASCPPPAQGMLGKTLQWLDEAPSSRGNCVNTAEHFHEAIRRFGEKHFLSDASTYCEYDGPPAPSGAARSAPDP